MMVRRRSARSSACLHEGVGLAAEGVAERGEVGFLGVAQHRVEAAQTHLGVGVGELEGDERRGDHRADAAVGLDLVHLAAAGGAHRLAGDDVGERVVVALARCAEEAAVALAGVEFLVAPHAQDIGSARKAARRDRVDGRADGAARALLDHLGVFEEEGLDRRRRGGRVRRLRAHARRPVKGDEQEEGGREARQFAEEVQVSSSTSAARRSWFRCCTSRTSGPSSRTSGRPIRAGSRSTHRRRPLRSG